ncbi:MAG: PAS domain S-box protein, partial [Dehalococcoidia bacterium]|nr:PAS domain S-box protein [Dehalococcoidia bacterium]
VLETGETQRIELVGGDGRDYELSSSAFVDVDGQVKVIEVVRDITERKREEEALRESEEYVKTILDSIQSGILVVDAETHEIVDANPIAIEMFGVPKEQVVGSICQRYICPAEVGQCPITDLGQAVDNSERVLLKANGESVPILKTVTPIILNGRKCLLESFTDITEQRESRNKLEELEVLESSILSAIPHAVIGLHERRIVFANKGVEAVFGWKPEGLIGKTTRVLYRSKEEYEEIASHFYPVLEREQSYSEEFPCRHKDGRDIVCMVSASRIGESLVEKKVVVTYEDVTERKKAEGEIKRRAAQAVLDYEVGQRVSSKLELDELLSEIVTAVRDAFDYYGVMILLVDEEAQRLTMQSIAGGYVDIFPRDLYHAIGEGMTGYAAASGKTQGSGDVSKDPHYVREADEETKSELAVPIKRGQKVIGVLDIQSDEFDAFDETDVMLMETLADQIAVAIENARLYEAVQQELAERKQAEEALRESEKHFRALIENSSDIIQIVDSEGIIRYLSPSVQRILGYKPEELIGRPSIDVVHPDDLPLVAKGFEEALQKPCVPVITVCRCKHKDGTWRVIEGTGINQLDNPSVNGFIANMHDITERRRTVEELEGSKKRFQTLFNIMVDPVVIVDGKGKFLEITDRVEEITGFKKAELLGRNFMRTNIVTAKSKAILMKNLAKRMMGMRVAPYEVEVLRKDGRRLPYEVNAAKIEYEGKGADMVSFRDISERKKAEEALRESEEFSSSLLDSSPNPILVVNPDTSIRYVNPALEKLTGFTSSELIGVKIPHPWWAEETRPQVQGDFEERMRKGAHRLEDVFKKKNGERFWVEITTRAIMRNGELQYHLSNWVDITEQKKSREQLERSFIELAETVSRAMSSRDPYTASHQRRVAELARLVGEKMGLDKDRLRGLYIGGLLHDIGKISTPESILSKPGQLAKEEWALIHAHAMRGYEILDGSRFPWPVAEMALHHHERLDGSGYPHGISGDRLSLENRILGVCDVVEAMSSRRPYRSARSKEEVLEEIKSGRGTKYAPDVVDIMLEIIESGEFEIGGEAK